MSAANSAGTESAGNPDQSSRTARFLGRAALRTVTTIERCYDCGREPLADGVAMRRTADGVVGFAGLVSCGRVWVCPVCNAKVMAKRAIEIGLGLAWASLQGYQVIWGSLTCAHDLTSDLGELLRIQRAAWRHVVSSKGWRRVSATKEFPHAHIATCDADCDRKKDVMLLPILGRVGYIRASELTIGPNGWHPHFHPLIIVKGSPEYAQKIADQITVKWVEGVKQAGGYAQLHGSQQLKVVRGHEAYDALSGYVTKATYDPSSMALEVVWSQGKYGRGRVKSTVAHWALLAAIEQGLADDADRWEELETATNGHRMIMWSRGLRSFAGIGVELSDEEEAAKDIGTAEDNVCFITGEGWRTVRDRPEVFGLFLDVLEASGWPGLRILLDEYGVEYIAADDVHTYGKVPTNV